MCTAPHSNKIEDGVRNLITTFWNDDTHPSSNCRDVIKHRIRPNEYVLHTKHWLETMQHEVYFSFCNLNPNIKIGQIMFKRFKPYYVKINKTYETFCCHHIEFDLYYQVLVLKMLHLNSQVSS